VLLGYLWARVPETRGRGTLWLAVGFVCLALTVPMLLLHVCGVMILLFLFDGPWTRAALWRRGTRILLPLAAALGLLAIHLAHVTIGQRDVTVIILAFADQTLGSARVQPEDLTPLASLALLARDFFSIKRWGLQEPWFDAALLGLGVLFTGALVGGIRRRQPLHLLLGCWGGLASVQVATGWLQFTAYQREGWSLLIATGVLGGVIAGELGAWRAGLKPWLLAGLVLSSIWTFVHPPAHPLLNSSAEEELIRSIRLLHKYPQWASPSDAATTALRAFLAQQLDVRKPVAVCSRSLVQAEVFRAVTGRNPQLVFNRITVNHPLSKFMAMGDQFLVVLDEQEDLSQHAFGVFGNVSPALRQNFIEQQQRRYATNRAMEAYVAGLPRVDWQVAEHTISPQLRMIVVRRATAAPAPGGER
jgi:hypothetical protein